MGKTNPLNEQDLEEFIDLQKKFEDSPLSWSVDVSSINQASWDLSVKNPNGNEEVIHRSPVEIISEIEALDFESQAILNRIKELL
jgi:type I restriction enzyme M protein